MTSRRRLPQRRAAIAVDLEHAGHRFRMQIGCFPDGAIGEVFLNATKQNSALDAFAADASILISLLLQHNVTPAEIGHALRRAPDGTAASLVGAVVDRLEKSDRVVFFELEVPLASSELRGRAEFEGAVPPAVARLIEREGLYGASPVH